MLSIYADNFRGFTDTLIPIDSTTFLVGENSTGKSSILKLLYIMSRPQFWMNPEFGYDDDDDINFGGFNDIVSALSFDKSYFRIGIVHGDSSESESAVDNVFILTFSNKDGTPSLSRYTSYSDGRISTLIIEKNRIKFRNIIQDDASKAFASHKDALTKVMSIDGGIIAPFKLLPSGVSRHMPIPVILSLANSLEKGTLKAQEKTNIEIDRFFVPLGITWIAPIRTKPRRFYDGLKKNFTPEGDHTPFVIKRSHGSRTKTKGFAERLSEFGRESGLFEAIIPHTFGRSPQAPFELLVKLSDVNLNISNVGYGVSQVLPLIVEFIGGRKNRLFAVQQPEVHLHPKAQAALGDFIFESASQEKISFIIETHSDYLIDRFRLAMSKSKSPPKSQVLFFRRTPSGNNVDIIKISSNGRYPSEQPQEFREFFVAEEISILDL